MGWPKRVTLGDEKDDVRLFSKLGGPVRPTADIPKRRPLNWRSADVRAFRNDAAVNQIKEGQYTMCATGRKQAFA